MFLAFFFKKVIFADIRFLSSGCGEIKRMVYWDMMQDKGKIGKYHFVTHFPPLWTDALLLLFFFFWWISSWWTVEHVMWWAFFLFVKPHPSPELNWKLNIYWRKCILEKNENKQKMFACLAAPYVLCHRATLSICSLFKKGKRCFSHVNAQTIEMAHMHEHWTCASFISLLIWRLTKYKVRLWRQCSLIWFGNDVRECVYVCVIVDLPGLAEAQQLWKGKEKNLLM